MAPGNPTWRRVVQTIPGPQTAGGPGDILIDDQGGRWLVISDYEPDATAAGMIRTHENGWIK